MRDRRASGPAGLSQGTRDRTLRPGSGETTGGVDVHCVGVVQLYRSGDADVVALRGVDLDVDPGEILALLGPSGSGKSTVMALLAGLFRPSAGEVVVGSHNLGRLSARELSALRASEIALVLQGPLRNLLSYATVEQNALFAQRGARRRGDRPLPSPGELFAELGLARLSDAAVYSLSGGEQQRVALAVGVATRPRLLLVDEPTSQLDARSRDEVVELLHQINAVYGTTIIVVTHDGAVSASMARTVTIRDGRVGAEGRHGTEYAVVGRDGAIQLPPDVLQLLPPESLVRLVRHRAGVDLRSPALEEGSHG